MIKNLSWTSTHHYVKKRKNQKWNRLDCVVSQVNFVFKIAEVTLTERVFESEVLYLSCSLEITENKKVTLYRSTVL